MPGKKIDNMKKNFIVRSKHDDLDISCIITLPESASPKAIVQLIHGMCEHKERYLPFMEYLSANGLACVIHDHRGHGESVKSSEDLGFFYDGGYEAMVDDVATVFAAAQSYLPTESSASLANGISLNASNAAPVASAASESSDNATETAAAPATTSAAPATPATTTATHSRLPRILFGHSMGSMVVRSFAKRYDDEIDMLIVCGSPSDNPAKGIGKWLSTQFGKRAGWRSRPALMQKISIGAYNKAFAKEGPVAWLSTDKDNQAAYLSDPLCQFQFTANGFYNLMALMQDCYSTTGWAMRNPDLPVWFISGTDDPCRTSDKAFRKAVDAMIDRGYANTTAMSFSGLRHEILNETTRAQVWSHILARISEIC